MKRKKKQIRGAGRGKKSKLELKADSADLTLSPQASPYRPARSVPRGWREGPQGILYYRVYNDGGFEVMGKIRDPEALAENFAELAEVLGQERVLQQHKKRRLLGRREEQSKTESRELFGHKKHQPEVPGVKLKDIKAL